MWFNIHQYVNTEVISSTLRSSFIKHEQSLDNEWNSTNIFKHEQSLENEWNSTNIFKSALGLKWSPS